MCTIQEEVAEALLRTGEVIEDLQFFHMPCHTAYEHDLEESMDCSPPQFIAYADLPTIEYGRGFGNYGGPSLIAFGPKYVYVRHEYDGASDTLAVPRSPDTITGPLGFVNAHA